MSFGVLKAKWRPKILWQQVHIFFSVELFFSFLRSFWNCGDGVGPAVFGWRYFDDFFFGWSYQKPLKVASNKLRSKKWMQGSFFGVTKRWLYIYLYIHIHHKILLPCIRKNPQKTFMDFVSRRPASLKKNSRKQQKMMMVKKSWKSTSSPQFCE